MQQWCKFAVALGGRAVGVAAVVVQSRRVLERHCAWVQVFANLCGGATHALTLFVLLPCGLGVRCRSVIIVTANRPQKIIVGFRATRRGRSRQTSMCLLVRRTTTHVTLLPKTSKCALLDPPGLNLPGLRWPHFQHLERYTRSFSTVPPGKTEAIYVDTRPCFFFPTMRQKNEASRRRTHGG